MSDYFILTKKPVPIILICMSVASSYVIWRKYYKHSCKVNKKDRLSELPIELSSQIFSNISIRDVATMATVSSHSRSVCLALPRLDLDWYVITGLREFNFHTPKCETYAQAYVKRVDQVLETYKNQNIQSVHISCCLNRKIYGGDIDRWMSFVASNKGLQSLSIQFICEDNSHSTRENFHREHDELHLVSGSFLNQFSYLKYLHLDTCILGLENELKLNNLSTLDLNNVEVSQWQGVFSCSSTIKCLWLRGCKLPSKLCIGNNFPCLSFLMIAECSDLKELEVGAWKLQRFDLHTSEYIKCSFSNIPNLERVYLYPQVESCANDILNNLAAKVSSLKHFFLRGIYSLMHKLPSTTVLFYSVSSLRISMIHDDGNILYDLPCLLKSFPHLKRLEMKLPEKPIYKTIGSPVLHDHTELEDVEIFGMKEEYMPIAIYLLKCAVKLKHMVVSRAAKGLNTYENLRWVYTFERFSHKECLSIRKSLARKASSANVELIVK